jgi:DNA repair exonuclease SbcCD ATPase subunit
MVMKIKCPVCGIEHEYLYSHLIEHDSKSLGKALYNLIFKIHEKIEELESWDTDGHFTDLTGKISLLKSLLEDKSK